MTPEQLAEIEAAFAELDKARDTPLSWEEGVELHDRANSLVLTYARALVEAARRAVIMRGALKDAEAFVETECENRESAYIVESEHGVGGASGEYFREAKETLEIIRAARLLGDTK